MIIEFKTDTGSVFRLDKDIMRWERTLNNRTTHGKLYAWPEVIEIGKRVWIFDTDPIAKIGKAFATSKVVSITSIEREQPDVAAH